MLQIHPIAAQREQHSSSEQQFTNKVREKVYLLGLVPALVPHQEESKQLLVPCLSLGMSREGTQQQCGKP